MGLNLLIQAQNRLAQEYPDLFGAGSGYTLGTLLCLEEFLLLLFGQGLLEAFINMLSELVTLANAVISELNLLIALANVIIEVTQTGINAVNGVVNDAESLINKFPFTNPDFLSCPLVQQIKAAISTFLSPITGFFKAIKKGEAWLLKEEYKLLREEQNLIDLHIAVEKIQVFVQMTQAIIQAAQLQFPGSFSSAVSAGKSATTPIT